MCGIAGILNLKGETLQAAAVRAMTDRIAHRGPDAEGIYADHHIALGHRRLSIIDLSESANQPMWDHAGRYALVFNGEIYNYQEVRAQLTDYPFRTHSDTEVVIAAYERWGVKSLERFNGMFAFVIWDTNEQVLFAARDRVGKKPFYYYHTKKEFIFSSEVRSILASGLVDSKLDETQLGEYFLYQAPMYEHSLIKGINRLPAGHYALVSKDKMIIEPYWGYDLVRPSGDHGESAKRHVRELFLEAVRLRMVSDVPVGAFLSGGIDSSLVVACMAEQSTVPVNTFTVSFDEQSYDESTYAEQIATLYKTNHHRLLVRPEEFLEHLDDILGDMDTPSGDGPNTWLVSRHTRQAGIKVALSGLGGDELFAGYDKFLNYHRMMKLQWFSKLPSGIRKTTATAMAMIRKSGIHKLAELSSLEKWDFAHVYPLLRRAYNRDEANQLLRTPMGKDEVEERLTQWQQQVTSFGHFSMCTVGELETYTRDVLLRDTDQMAMAHALEVRVPFFDYKLIEYVLSLSDAVKYPHTPKQLLVEAMAPRLPRQISHRRKMGFTLPIHHWLKNELGAFADEKIHQLAARPEFNEQGVHHKWNAFKDGDPSVPWTRTWQMVVLSDWLQRNKM